MGHDNSSRRELEQRAWEEHNLSQLRYFRSLSLREKMEAVEGMADVLRRFEEMRARGEFTSPASGGAPQRKPGNPVVADRVQAARRALELYMRHVSEENWAAGWFTGLEFTLWAWVQRYRSGAEPASEFERANRDDIEIISWLAEEAGGWWFWHDSVGARFAPLGEWLEMLENKSKPDVE